MKPSRDIPDELLGVAETLENNRPQLHGLEADRIKRRAMAQASTTATRTSTKGLFMRSRLAITSLLALGLLMTGSGAALGLSALSVTGSASQAQYGTAAGNPTPTSNPTPSIPHQDPAAPPTTNPDDEVLGEVASDDEAPGVPGNQDQGGGGDGETDVLGTAAAGGEAPEAVAQGSRQLAAGAGSSELAFTGFAAIPVLLIGIVLLAAGLVLRRNPGHSPAQS